MLLKNYYKLIAGICASTSSEAIPIKVIDWSGQQHEQTTQSSAQPIRFMQNSESAPYMGNIITSAQTYKQGIIFGDGSTAPTLDDYKLSGNVISTISGVSALTRQILTDAVEVKAIISITNTGAESITISECGVLISNNTGSTHGEKHILVDRTVLDVPVTIEAGGIGVVEYKIRINIPTA